MYYTYVWRDANGVPFYVGKGTGKRAYRLEGRTKEFKDIHAFGGCAVEIVDYFIHESQAHAHEIELIAQFGRQDNGTGTLVNKTDGGEGASGATWKLGPEARANISRSKMGKPSPRLGVKLSAETRAKLSKSHMGKTLSKAARVKVGIVNRGKVVSQDTRDKLKAIFTGRLFSAETIAKMSAAQKRRKHTEEEREKRSASLMGNVNALGHQQTVEHKAAISAAQRASPPRGGEFKGVSFRANRKKWRAYIKVHGKTEHLGYFTTPEGAARAYDTAAYAAWGDQCYLNFGVPMYERRPPRQTPCV